MPFDYRLHDPSAVFSPSLLFYPEVIQRNLARAVEVAGTPNRLRPHVKTHKTREITRLWLAAGVSKHKCATIAEAEMLATCDVPDVLIAYPLVAPNPGRLATLIDKFPATRFGVSIDHELSLQALSQAVASQTRTGVGAFLDINCGMNRTGIVPGEGAFELYRRMSKSPGLRLAGFHVYDGHNNHESSAEREKAIHAALTPVLQLRERAERAGLPVPTMVLGGTPGFAIHAKSTEPGIEFSPGTLSLHDHNYGTRYPELGMGHAALLLTRVISNPGGDFITLDLGYKAVSPDSPAGKRCVLLDIGEYEAVGHSEEHLVIRAKNHEKLPPGTVVYAIPAHVCPSVALHQYANIVKGGSIVGRWPIVARDRELTV